MRSRRYAVASGLALAYSLALLGDQMLYVFLPSHPAEAGITAASLGIILSANRFVRLAANSLGGLASDGSAGGGLASRGWCWRSSPRRAISPRRASGPFSSPASWGGSPSR